jgi:hypothetical protein
MHADPKNLAAFGPGDVRALGSESPSAGVISMTHGAAMRYFKEIEESLLAQARASVLLGSSASKGRTRERLIGDFLRDHLPERLSVRSGEVIDSNGNSTGEADLTLVDHNQRIHKIGGIFLCFLELCRIQGNQEGWADSLHFQ